MKKREKSSKWDIRADQRNGIDWNTIHDCLAAKGKQQEFNSTMFGSFFSDPYFFINSFQEECSKAEPLIQIAALFSGLAVFSKDKYCKYKKWQQQNATTLFEEEKVSFTNKEEYRFKILELLNNKCKSGKYGAVLDSSNVFLRMILKIL